MTANRETALVDIEQAAARLGTTVRFLRRLIAERRIPYFKIGRHIRIDIGDLDRFIAAARVEPRH